MIADTYSTIRNNVALMLPLAIARGAVANIIKVGVMNYIPPAALASHRLRGAYIIGGADAPRILAIL